MKCFFQLNKSVFIRYITNTISIDDIIEFDYSIIDFASKKNSRKQKSVSVLQFPLFIFYFRIFCVGYLYVQIRCLNDLFLC